MTPDTVNPELLLAAWETAFPEFAKAQGKVTVRRLGATAIEILRGYAVVSIFDPLKDGADAHALMLALMDYKNGAWQFGKTRCDEQYIAWKTGDHYIVQSSATLLLRCVSAQTNIPLYLSHIKEHE